MRLFHGRQGTRAAMAGQLPGLSDPANPAKRAKAPASQGAEALQQGFHAVTPVEAAATMHNDLSDDAKMHADGLKNIPLDPIQVPSEGSDTQETEGDGSVRDPTGIGFGT